MPFIELTRVSKVYVAMQQTAAKTGNSIIRLGDREDVQITPVLRGHFRPVTPADKAALTPGFERLSAALRYRHFLASKKALRPAELRFFTEPEGGNHIAIAVVAIDARGWEGEGVAIGHLLRLSDEREMVELALTIIDAGQGLGLGRMLLERLIAAARERGVQRIRAHFLADNARMRHLIECEVGEIDFTRDGESLTGEFPQAVDRCGPWIWS